MSKPTYPAPSAAAVSRTMGVNLNANPKPTPPKPVSVPPVQVRSLTRDPGLPSRIPQGIAQGPRRKG
jgi:hypothetical protein